MKRSWGFIITIVLLFFFFFMAMLGYLAKSDNSMGLAAMTGRKKIAIANIYGVFTTQHSDRILKILHRYREDDSIAAVVLRIDSGGGGVAAAQELMAEVIKLRAAGKKVVVSMGEVAASGGYYVACAADRIFANPGTLTGSIGVIMEVPNLELVFEKIGLGSQVVKSGKYKDIASAKRTMTSDERDLLQGMIDDVYEQFVEAISQGRSLPLAEVKQYADGRVFSGRKALEYGLIDELGDLDDAVKAAGRLAGLGEKPSVIKDELRRGIFIPLPGVEGWFDRLIGQAPSGVRLGYIFR